MSVRRIKWKTLVVLAAVLAVGVVVSCLFIRKMRERKEFVSKVVAGYRYRCTLSNDWRTAPNSSPTPTEMAEEYTFSSAPSPIREWIATHLFHQQPATKSPQLTPNGRPQLMLVTETGKKVPEIKIQAGYPELDLGRQTIPGLKVIPGKHFRMDNCPATMTGLNLTAFGVNSRCTYVLVCTPDYTNTYVIVSVAEARDSDQADREMRAVIDSFHVEKVDVPSGGKR